MSQKGLLVAVVVGLLSGIVGTTIIIVAAAHNQPKAYTDISSASAALYNAATSTSFTTTVEGPPKRLTTAEQKLTAVLNDHCDKKFVGKAEYLGDLFSYHIAGPSPLSFKDIKVFSTETGWSFEVDAVVVCRNEKEVIGTTSKHASYRGSFSNYETKMEPVRVLWLIGRTLSGELKADPKPVTLVVHGCIDAQFQTKDIHGNTVSSLVTNTMTSDVTVQDTEVNWANIDPSGLFKRSEVHCP